MYSVVRRYVRFEIVAALGLALSMFAAGCSVDPVVWTGLDAQVPPGPGTLTVVRDGTSTGMVSSNPGGIICGATCSAVFPAGTMVTLTAAPDTGAEFVGWSGGGCTGTAPSCMVTVEAAVTVTATFDIARYPVTIDLGGSGAGTVVAPLAGINCPGSCTGKVPHGSQLALTASSGASSQFMGWTVGPGGTGCAGTGVCSTTITGPTTITATFALYQSLEVVKSGNGGGTVTSSPPGIDCGADCSEQYLPGTTVTLTAAAAADSIFMGWSGGGCTGTGPCSVDINSATMVTADFVLKKYDLAVTKAGAGVGTVMSTPGGIDCGPTCATTYDAGTQVTLVASPAAGSVFAGWSGGGCTGTNTCVVTMTAATSVTAMFAPILHTLTVVRTGTGAGTVASTPAGINCGGDCTEDYPEGAMVTLTATPGTGSTFTGWSGGCSGTGTCTVPMAAAASVTASFAIIQHTLAVVRAGGGSGTVTSSPAGITCGPDCTEAYDVGSSVTLTAAPGTGATFAGWSGGGCSGTGTCTVTMTAAITVTATFTLNRYPLTVSRSGTGSGTITSSPSGIACGADCTEDYDHGTMVALTPAPAVGSTFGGWGGACSGTGTCVVTMTAAKSVSAIFTANQYAVTVAKTGAGSGTVTSSPSGINCGTDCTEPVDHGTLMTLTATPAAGSMFGGWSGGGCSGTGACVITVTAATTVTASFEPAPFALTVTRAGSGTGTVTSSPAGISCGTDCTEPYASGTVVTLTAAAAPGSTFAGWSGGGCSGTGTCAVTVTAAVNVTATFTLDAYALAVAKAGSGSGTVTSSPAGISCGATCSATYGHGTTVALTAAPAAGSTFAGWSGGGCSGTGTCAVTMTAATTVTATFTFNSYTLSVARTGTGSGTVTSSPAGITCGADCTEVVGHGSVMTLTAAPAAGSTFSGWSGGGCSGTGTCTVTVTAATTVTATFTLNTYTLSVARTGTGSGTVTSSPPGITCGGTCSQSVSHGSSVTLAAAPAAGSAFAGWSGGGCSGTGSCVVVMTSATTVTAAFVRTCGNGVCSGGEDCASCPSDCGSCGPVCGDGDCNGSETCASCPGDCGSCCGNGVCGGGETCASCPSDCGPCGPVCPNGACEAGENCGNCPSDCGPCGPVCPNGACEAGENCGSCPSDCGFCDPCGNGICDGWENCQSCPGDCGFCDPEP